LSIRHVHAVLLNLDVAGRIDRWWSQLTVAEQGSVLDNVEQLPERFVAELCAAGIGGATRGRLPDSVRNHLRRIGVRSEQLAAAGACLVSGGQEW
jgi:hypothetical protein